MIDPVKLGYELGVWKSNLHNIALKVCDISLGLSLQIETIVDEIDDFIRNNKNDD